MDVKTPTLKTKNLILRPITIDDAPAVQKHFNDWNIIKNMTLVVPWPYPDDGALTHIRDNVLPKVATGESYVWAITLKNGDDEAIGIIDYRMDALDNGNRGFWLAKKHQRQGLMSEAVSAVNDFVFDILAVDSFIVSNVKGNIGSKRIKEKTGAIYLHDAPIKHHDGNIAEIWQVTKKNWEKVKNGC